MTTVLSKGAFADHLGVSKPRVSALVKRGLPVRPDRKIDLEIALEWMRANVATQARFQDRGIHRILARKAASARKASRPAASPEAVLDESDALDDDTAALPYAAAKALRETFLARKARLEFLKENGRLLSVEIVESKWTRILTGARNRLLACPSRIGARIAHLSKIRDRGDRQRDQGGPTRAQRGVAVLIDELEARVRLALKPPPRLDLAEWLEKNIRLPGEVSALREC